MVVGLGVDIVEVARIKKFVAGKTKEALKRIFTKEECDYAFSSPNYLERLAVRFAVKEAFFKAFGAGSFKEIETYHQHSQKPSIRLHNKTKKMWDSKFPQGEILVSLSHTEHYAQAIVILQITNNPPID